MQTAWVQRSKIPCCSFLKYSHVVHPCLRTPFPSLRGTVCIIEDKPRYRKKACHFGALVSTLPPFSGAQGHQLPLQRKKAGKVLPLGVLLNKPLASGGELPGILWRQASAGPTREELSLSPHGTQDPVWESHMSIWDSHSSSPSQQ